MKKLLQVCLAVVLIFILTVGLIQTVGRLDPVAGGSPCLRVGWNTRSVCVSDASASQVFAAAPILSPNVGWNK